MAGCRYKNSPGSNSYAPCDLLASVAAPAGHNCALRPSRRDRKKNIKSERIITLHNKSQGIRKIYLSSNPANKKLAESGVVITKQHHFLVFGIYLLNMKSIVLIIILSEYPRCNCAHYCFHARGRGPESLTMFALPPRRKIEVGALVSAQGGAIWEEGAGLPAACRDQPRGEGSSSSLSAVRISKMRAALPLRL